jgi:cation transporter-like permease
MTVGLGNGLAGETRCEAMRARLWGYQSPVRRAVTGWPFLVPALIFFLGWQAYPIVRVAWLSFTDYHFIRVGEPVNFVGLDNYVRALTDPLVLNGLLRAFVFTLLYVPGVLIIPLLAAILLDRVTSNRLQGAYRLLILLPAFLQEGGALGGILSSRLSSKIHLGLLEPRGVPPMNAFRDFTLIYIFATGVYIFIGGASHVVTVAIFSADASPGFLTMIGISTLAGLIATTAAAFAAYYGSILSYRVGLDPDTYGIPIITAAVDVLGFMSLIIALIAFGLVG